MVLRWPGQEEIRRSLAEAGVPRLLVVAPGCQPPLCPDPLEDWVASPGDPAEMEHRRATLAARAASSLAELPVLEEGNILWFRDRWVALSPAEATLVRTLVGHYQQCAPRRALGLDGADKAATSALYTQISRVRRRIEPLGLVVRSVRSRGFVLSPVS